MAATLVLFLVISSSHIFSQWFPQTSGTNVQLYSVNFVNNLTGFAVGDSGKVVNFFSGSATPSGRFNESTIIPSTRFGVDINGGVDWHLSKVVGAVNGVKYNLANIIGRKDGTEAVVGKHGLEDKAYTDQNGDAHNSRNINYIQVYTGISLYLMQTRKKN